MNNNAELLAYEHFQVDNIVWNSGIISIARDFNVTVLNIGTAMKKTLSGKMTILGMSYWEGGDIEMKSPGDWLEIAPERGVLSVSSSAGNFTGDGTLTISGTLDIARRGLALPNTVISHFGALGVNAPILLHNAVLDNVFIYGSGSINISGTSEISGQLLIRSVLNNFGTMTWNRQGSGSFTSSINNFGTFIAKVGINVGGSEEIKIGRCAPNATFIVAPGAVVTFSSYPSLFECNFGGLGTVVVPSSSQFTFSGAGSIGNLYLLLFIFFC